MNTGSGGRSSGGSGETMTGESGASIPAGGAGEVAMPPGGFDAGIEPDRNAVMPGGICDRIATIECAGEVACCANPGRDFNACKQEALKGCAAGGVSLDSVAEQKAANFDAQQAETAFTHLEELAKNCDPAIAEYSAAPDGMRSIFRGTVAPNGNCAPLNMFDMTMAAGALASCENGDAYACMPALTGPWNCAPHAAAGGKCFTDVNCMPNLYCDNPKLSISGSTCKPRKNDGASCATSNECRTLFCRGNTCQPASAQAAYCLAGAQ